MLRKFADNRLKARKGYKGFVGDGLVNIGESPWKKLVGQNVFGGEEFATHIHERISEAREIGEIPRAQRFSGRPPLEAIFPDQEPQKKVTRNTLITKAHVEHGYTLKEIADQLNIHYTTVSKVLKASRAAQD